MSIKEMIRTALFFAGFIIYRNKKSKIIYYHDFFASNDKVFTNMATSLDLFKVHLMIARKCGYKIVDRITSPQKEIAVMLDDGFRGVWECRDFFYQESIHPTIFIAKELVGQDGYLSEKEIIELAEHGWIFQSHTVSHSSLTDFSIDRLDYELVESKLYLENLLGRETKEICAPLGEYSNLVCEHAYRIGYDVFYSSTPGNYFEKLTDFSFVITRNLCQSLTPYQFHLAINGGYKIFQRVYFKRRYKTINVVNK